MNSDFHEVKVIWDRATRALNEADQAVKLASQEGHAAEAARMMHEAAATYPEAVGLTVTAETFDEGAAYERRIMMPSSQSRRSSGRSTQDRIPLLHWRAPWPASMQSPGSRDSGNNLRKCCKQRENSSRAILSSRKVSRNISSAHVTGSPVGKSSARRNTNAGSPRNKASKME